VSGASGSWGLVTRVSQPLTLRGDKIMKTNLTISEMITILVEMEERRDRRIDQFRWAILYPDHSYPNELENAKYFAREYCSICRKLATDVGCKLSDYVSDFD
jgi:hypothetical protein